MQTRQTEPQGFQSDRAPCSHGIDATSEAAFSQSQNHDLSDPREKRRFWEHHLNQCRQSHQTQKAYCEMHGLKIHQFYYWKRRLKTGQDKIAFLPLPLPGDLFAPHSPYAVRIITPNGFAIELQSPVNLSEVLTLAAGL